MIRGCGREIVSQKRKEMEKEEEEEDPSLRCMECPYLCTWVATHFSPQTLYGVVTKAPFVP